MSYCRDSCQNFLAIWYTYLCLIFPKDKILSRFLSTSSASCFLIYCQDFFVRSCRDSVTTFREIFSLFMSILLGKMLSKCVLSFSSAFILMFFDQVLCTFCEKNFHSFTEKIIHILLHNSCTKNYQKFSIKNCQD